MKKLINDPGRVVTEMLEGMVAMHPGFLLIPNHNVVVRADYAEVRDQQVALISGGGSGHEPAHAGFVGPGMLSAAVAGEVFTSPPVTAVFSAIKAVAGSRGVLLIVKNYTGDRLNFGLAAEIARNEGIAVETVIVADDIAVSSDRGVRRGLAGTVLVHKITGAAAAEGKPLEQVAEIARAAAFDISTIGISLSAGTVPAVGKPSYILPPNEIELGLGIHGEPGVLRIGLRSANELADLMLRRLREAATLPDGSRILLLVNNLGSTTPMELSIVARRAIEVLQQSGLHVERVYSGTFMTSLEAAGVSLSIMPVEEQRLRWLDAATDAPAWPRLPVEAPRPATERIISVSVSSADSRTTAEAIPKPMRRVIEAACHALIAQEDRLTTLDQAVGDGDLGISLSRGARAILDRLPSWHGTSADALKEVGLAAQEVIGGSSGPLYGVLFLRAAAVLQNHPTVWAEAAYEACQTVSEVGGAQKGDRTMLDALIPFASAFKAGDLTSAVRAAEAGAESTAQMFPRKGRSSYLGERALGHPDPGAVAVTIWLRAVADSLRQS
ncbi:MAG: dihydroxyacetone kinase subunit DhaK [Acidobacteriaceae bacterium]|nr:dihydroxyacetone kinase subunit DhaK [Acidobacteriaceae bacterium]